MSVSVRRSRQRARVVLAGLSTGLSVTLLAACGGDPSGDEPTPTPEPTTAEPTTSAEAASLDPCALLDATTVSQTLGGDLRVTSRHASPSDAGWETTCGYGTILGSYSVSVTVSTEVDPETFPNEPGDKGDDGGVEGRDGELGELQPIEDLGDAAWTEVVEPTQTYSTGSVRVHALRGDHGVRITTNYQEDEEPNVDGTVELGRAALPELPAEFTIPAFDLEPPCTDVDTDAAAEAAGSKVVSGRSLVDGEDVACEFILADGVMSIWSLHGDDAVTMFEQGPAQGTPVEGLGDDAFTMGDGIGALHVRQGDRVVSISAFSSSSPPPRELTDQQVAFVESVLAALE